MIRPGDIEHIKTSIACGSKSMSEGGPPRPKVGAVLVKEEAVLDVAYRGDSLPGNHAEFVLLEKKLRDKSVSGATLYTTLEPCTERNEPKQACVERIIERKLARVVIGILDPNQNICGRGVRRLRKAGIEVDLFPAEYMAEVEDQNREFIRYQEEITAAAQATPVLGLTLERVEFEPAPDWNYKFKFRMYWTNDGGQLHLGEASWIPGGIGIQGHKLGYRFQTLKDGAWGPETLEAEVAPLQEVRIYVGLDPDQDNVQMANTLLEKGRLGTLVLPVTTSGKCVEVRIRPKATVLKRRENAEIKR